MLLHFHIPIPIRLHQIPGNLPLGASRLPQSHHRLLTQVNWLKPIQLTGTSKLSKTPLNAVFVWNFQEQVPKHTYPTTSPIAQRKHLR